MSGAEEFAAGVGGKVVGHATNEGWDCTECEASGTSSDSTQSALALYVHRKEKHDA